MTKQSAKEIIESFEGIPVLVIGDVMLDAYIWGMVERVSPEAPVPVVKVINRDYRLGGAANVALNLKALGAIPLIVSVIGQDEAGVKFTDRLKNREISAEGIVHSAIRPTTVKTRVIASHQHVVRVDDETDKDLSAEELQEVIQKIDTLLPKCKAVVFEDYDKGVLDEHIISHVISSAKKLGIPTIVDPKKRNFLSYKGVTLFKPNLKELREGLKTDIQAANMEQVKIAVEKLKDMLDANTVMVTLSEHGVYMDGAAGQFHQPAHVREIADVSGAGDTVVSVAALCVASGIGDELTASLSNLAGGLVCQHVGVVPISKEDLTAEVFRLLGK
jgi:D-glycero-beta-D-manno-heptose-7-phosphate kinase